MSDRAPPAKAAVHVLQAFHPGAAGTTISYLDIEDYFKKRRIPLRDTTSGLRLARCEGWITVASFHAITLLAKGIKAIKDSDATPNGN